MSESRLGLKALVAAALPHECPFCGDPRKKRQEGGWNNGRRGPGRPAKGAPEGYDLTCGDPECAEVAYHRYWRVDANARNAERKRQMALHLSVVRGTTLP